MKKLKTFEKFLSEAHTGYKTHTDEDDLRTGYKIVRDEKTGRLERVPTLVGTPKIVPTILEDEEDEDDLETYTDEDDLRTGHKFVRDEKTGRPERVPTLVGTPKIRKRI